MSIATNGFMKMYPYGAPSLEGGAHGLFSAIVSGPANGSGGTNTVRIVHRVKSGDINRIYLLRSCWLTFTAVGAARSVKLDGFTNEISGSWALMNLTTGTGRQTLVVADVLPLMIVPDPGNANFIVAEIDANVNGEDAVLHAFGEYWETQQTRLSGFGPRVEW